MDEHVHEWELGMEWSNFCDDPDEFDGYILTCKHPDCDATISENPWSDDKPITARINAAERLSDELPALRNLASCVTLMFKYVEFPKVPYIVEAANALIALAHTTKEK